MIEFSIPDFWEQSLLNSFVLNAKRDYPEFFNDDITITSCFGSFPCIWSGGRGLLQGAYTKEIIIRIISFFNEHNVSIRHTFTNRFLNENDKYDHICNQICELTCEVGQLYNIKNGCIIYDDSLGEYIKEKYPDLEIIYSTTKELKTIEELNKYSQKNIVIPSYTINHNIELLKQLQYPENIELLCIEQGCIQNCPNRTIHQDCVSKFILKELDSPESMFDTSHCPFFQEPYINWYQWCNNPQIYISLEQIRADYLSLGFNKYKIAGRGASPSVLLNDIESYLHYFFKPEYQNFIRIELLNLMLEDQLVIPIGALNM